MLKLIQPSIPSYSSISTKKLWKSFIFVKFSSQINESPQEAGPWHSYSQNLLDNTLAKDPHQENVVRHLQQVYEEVKKYEKPTTNLLDSGGFFKFLKKSKPQKILAPKGLYIYGSVGGGKTMLMDLFYETVPVSNIYDNE